MGDTGAWRANQGTAPRIVVIGSGSLARSLCYSIATEVRSPADVLILARNDVKAAEVAFVSATRACVSEVPVSFRGMGADLGALDEILAAHQPDVLVQCASYQSPWERSTAPSAWTELIAAAGFGITLPLQAALVLDVAETMRAVAPHCLLINACFPDAVNPVLLEWELPVFCGIGNISTLAASVQSVLGRKDQSALHLVAHHVHLHAPHEPAAEARLWCDGVDRPDVGDLLAGLRSTDRAELNHVGGHAAARLVAAVLTGADLDTHVPGPAGLPGGYPVRVTGDRIELRLPPGVDAADAVAWNQRMSLDDGVQVADGRVCFPPRAQEYLRPHLPAMADGYPVGDIRPACAELLDLRDRLRATG